eukprot:7297675-Prymnesium_polylepis.3
MRACDNPTSDVLWCQGVRGVRHTGRGIMAALSACEQMNATGQQLDGALEGSCTSAHAVADAAFVRVCDRCMTGCSSAPLAADVLCSS